MKEYTLLKNRISKNYIEVVLSCAILLFLWEIVAVLINNEIYLPTIGKVIKELKEIILSTRFLIDIFTTMQRTIISFFIALLGSIIIGVLGYMSRIIRNFFRPINMIAQSIPMMILIVLALIWFNKDNAPYIVGIMITFPILYENILGALMEMDKSLIEMSSIYNVSQKDRIINIYFPSIKFRLAPTIASTISLALKIVIAGEVYGQPNYGIGSMIQLEKVNFNTPGIFAWLLIVIFVSMLLNTFQRMILRRIFVWMR